MNKFMIEGLDRLGKDTLINGILNTRGYHQVLHFSKPVVLDIYKTEQWEVKDHRPVRAYSTYPLKTYQEESFKTMFSIMSEASSRVICNRAHLGECVYAPMYRGYDGQYVFDLEQDFQIQEVPNLRLVLLTQNFKTMGEIVDDGESFDFSKREQEQELFIAAFEKSIIADKRIVNVTADGGGFKPREQILHEVIQ
jgi:thymidylate kinase